MIDSPELIDGQKFYLAEVWVEADDNQHFTRRLTSTMQLSDRMLDDPKGRNVLTERLEQAWNQVIKVTSGQLTDSYSPQ